MQRVPFVTGNCPNFLGGWILKNPSLTDNILKWYDSNPGRQSQGRCGNDGINLFKKDCVDITLQPNEIHKEGYEAFKEYFDELFLCYKITLITFCASTNSIFLFR